MNRNKLIEIFISNLTNSIVHQILEKAIDQQEIAERYYKEVKNSWEIAKNYREKINPENRSLSIHDTKEIKDKITRKVNSELNLRISKGYQNINLSLVEELTNDALKNSKSPTSHPLTNQI